MSALLQAIGQSWRAALRRPGFLVLASLTLALGVGACAAVFALVDQVLLRAPPYPAPDRLVMLGSSAARPWAAISPQDYQGLDGLPGIVSRGAIFVPRDVNVAGGDAPELASAWPVDAGLLPTLGLRLELGRNFSAAEDQPGGAPAVILGHAFWQRHFAGDAGVLGRTLLVDGIATPVIGVLPADFRLQGTPDLLLPLALAPASTDGATNLLVFARLAPDASLAETSRAFATRVLANQRERGFSYENLNPAYAATPLAWNLGATARPVLLLFLACAGCVLLLVAVNLANLMLFRSFERAHASAVRAALGAPAGALALPALGEGLLVGLCGALGGLVLAALLLLFLRDWLPAGWLATAGSPIGLPTVAFALLAGLAVGALASLFGIWRGRNRNAVRELAAGTRMGASLGAQRYGRALVVVQAGLATLLLATSMLLAHTLWQLSRVDLGFDARQLVTFRMNPTPALYPQPADLGRFVERLRERLLAEPGIEAAAVTTTLPIGGQLNLPLRLDDGSEPGNAIQYRLVSPSSFATLGIPLLAGRDFADQDRTGSEPVAIVSASFVEQFLGGAALGRSFSASLGAGWTGPPMRIVGVVGDVRQFGPGEDPQPTVYAPLAQVPAELLAPLRQFVQLQVVARVSGPAASRFAQLRAALREVDPRQGSAGLRLLERDVAEATAPQRMNAALVGLFALLAILLAAVGLYSVTAVAVAARRQEYGVRAALGAAPAALARAVLGRGLGDTAAGLALGLLATLAGARLLEGFLAERGATDPAMFALTATILLAAGCAATVLPALRAARTAPATALRND